MTSSFKGYLNEHRNINLADEGPGHIVLPVKSNTLTPSVTFTRLRPPTLDSPNGRTRGRSGGLISRLFNRIHSLLQLRAPSKDTTLKWLKNPRNLLVLAWLIPTIIAGIIYLMISFGWLDSAIPNKRERDDIYEVCNQILNALFVLRALCLQPVKTLHLFWVVWWRFNPNPNPTDNSIVKLRAVYCKDGLRKPYERVHILVVLLLLQLSYLSTYAMAGLGWGFKRSVRPTLWVNVMFGLTLGSGIAARIYLKRSPLGRDYVLDDGQDSEIDQNSHDHLPC